MLETKLELFGYRMVTESKSENEKAPINQGFMHGTEDGSRTRTVLLPRDFKSLVSTSSTTSA